MADIAITNLTNATDTEEGTGVLDILLQNVIRNIEKEYDEGRITGTEYATVYLGALQSTLQQAITFVLQEQESGYRADLIKSQIKESEEKMDLIIAQTAKEYEAIKASEARTIRENILNNKQVLKLQSETTLTDSQNNEVIASTTRENDKAAASIALDNERANSEITQQQVAGFQSQAKLDKELGFNVTANATKSWNIDAITAGTDGIVDAQRSEVLAKTTRENSMNTEKLNLVQAQTLGFKTDTKQKVLRQMLESWSVAFSVAPGGQLPTRIQPDSVDDVVENIMSDVANITWTLP